MSDWQPIETAPKDGDDILVVHADNRSFLTVVSFEGDEGDEYPWWTPDGPRYHKDAFSHWFPLPDPPPP